MFQKKHSQILFWLCLKKNVAKFYSHRCTELLIKFVFSKKATQIWWNLPLDLKFTKVNVILTGRFRQIFVAFVENLNRNSIKDWLTFIEMDIFVSSLFILSILYDLHRLEIVGEYLYHRLSYSSLKIFKKYKKFSEIWI